MGGDPVSGVWGGATRNEETRPQDRVSLGVAGSDLVSRACPAASGSSVGHSTRGRSAAGAGTCRKPIGDAAPLAYSEPLVRSRAPGAVQSLEHEPSSGHETVQADLVFVGNLVPSQDDPPPAGFKKAVAAAVHGNGHTARCAPVPSEIAFEEL